jgi:hypothetical protein
MRRFPLIVVAVLLVLTFVVTRIIARSEHTRSGAKLLHEAATPR